MNYQRTFLNPRTAGLVLAAAVTLTLTGCVGYVDGPRGEGYAFAVQDDYVYYPQFECYYSVSRHQYAYRNGNAWVARPGPRGVSVNVLQASPSVQMDFHDSPAHHHATVARQYPKNWKPSGPSRKDDQRNDHHGR